MSETAGHLPPPRVPRPLLLKLALIMGVPFAVFSAASFYFFTEWSRARFLEDTLKIREEGEEEMRANMNEVLATSDAIVKGLVEKITESNRVSLSELPLGIWGVDGEREADIKEEIRLHGKGLEERSLASVAAINRVFRERAEARLKGRVEAMRARQENASDLFARRLQEQSVLFLAASILLLGGVLWAGLWFTVLKPVRRLHEGTEKAGAGDLSYRVEALARDELGMLGRSFNRMSGELAGSLRELASEQKALSRANKEIREWNVTLEEKVRSKTSELEASLAALKQTQAELIHAAKMAGIGTLAGGIAHEFNNMLGGISGCAQDALEEDDPSDVKEALRIILRTSERACTVVENLLRFSRKTPSEPLVLDLPELASDTLRLLEGELSRAGIGLERDFGEGCRVEADPSQMQQVFLNLLTNALHAVEEEAERRIRVAVRSVGDEVVATVGDSGPGISEAIAERIFDPFFTTKDGRGAQARLGTGLGLSVTYGILEAHGGNISAGRSRLGGAEFTFRMPRAAKPV